MVEETKQGSEKQEAPTAAQDEQSVEKEDTTSPEAEQDKNESAESEEEVDSEDSIDYKGELEKEKARREKAEARVIQYKKEKKPQVSEEDIEKKIDDAVDQKLQKRVEDDISEELNLMSDNEDERELVKFVYENRIKPTGFSRQAIRQDLENARLLANKSRILKENTELAESLKAKQTQSSTSLGANQETKFNSTRKFSEADKKVMQRFDLKPEDIPKESVTE